MSDLPLPPSRGAFPAPLMWSAGALVLFAIVVAGIGHLTGAGDPSVTSTPVAMRQLRFTDRPDGGVDVVDAQTGALLETVTGQSGFLRGTVRTLASERKRAHLSYNTPFRLTAWKDGRLTLDDDTDHRHVELEAFGASNEAVFIHIMTDRDVTAPKGEK